MVLMRKITFVRADCRSCEEVFELDEGYGFESVMTDMRVKHPDDWHYYELQDGFSSDELATWYRARGTRPIPSHTPQGTEVEMQPRKDLSNQLSWNLTQTVIWIATRNSRELNKWGNDSLAFLLMAQEDDMPEDADLLELLAPAMAELWDQLDKGHIHATGVTLGGQFVEIDQSLWSRLLLKNDSLDDFRSANEATLIIPATDVYFRDVGFRSAEILNLWGPLQPPRSYEAKPLTKEATHASPIAPTERARQKSQQNRVKPFLDQLFPGGLPDPSQLTDTQLVEKVAKAMDGAAKIDPNLGKAPSRETILRAAGRK
jgi:hypothetical protein